MNPDLQEERDKKDFNEDDIEAIILYPSFVEYQKQFTEHHRENP